jgi:glycosyltransferase involved in cell wall biosynthesis
MTKVLPKVSFLIPTLNAAEFLETCLQSIRRQDYPQDRIEILIADGGSSDATRQIALKYETTVLDNPGRGYASGKLVALRGATGQFAVFVDADNELTHADFLTLAVAGLQKYPLSLGLESYYLPSPRMNSFSVYLSHLLYISDPVAWMMSVEPLRIAVDGLFERWTFAPNTLAWPMGANGFVFWRADLVPFANGETFEDSNAVVELAQKGRREWLRLTDRGVHHFLAKGLRQFIRKRRRNALHFLSQRGQRHVSWTQMNPRIPGWMACLLCATLVVPFYQTIRGLIKTRNGAWLWHPVASFISVLGVGWALWTHLYNRKP